MNSSRQTKKLLGAAIGAAVLFTAAGQAQAAPYFEYDLDGLSGAGSVITANGIAGVSSEHLFVTGAETFAGSGWVQFATFTDESASIPGTEYSVTGLYGLFDIEVQLTSGPFGGTPSLYDITTFNFSFWVDADRDNSFTEADASTLTLATVGNTGDDILIASGSLIDGTAGLFGTLTTIQTFLGVSGNFELEPGVGENYFFDPVPFYEIALAAFSSTGGEWQFNQAAGFASVGNATGGVDFQRVPEPATLALLGIGLIGVGASLRRRNKAEA